MSNKKFAEVKRVESLYRPAEERKHDYCEVERSIPVGDLQEQAARCMNCGIPFCHGAGCPLGNNIPEINAAARDGEWLTAWELLSANSPFPEFTSRVCPALCEEACCAGISFEPVMIRQLEKLVVESAYAKGFVTVRKGLEKKGKSIAVIGAGPAGLAAANELNFRGYSVTVYDRNELPGGLLRYGIPKFKLEKSVIDRRIALMEKAGVHFVGNTQVGLDVSAEYLARRFDAVLIAYGTPTARDLPIPGRDLPGIHFALDFLNGAESAKDRNVLIIGGGDTGSDCVGTSIRQGAKSVLQIEIMPKPPVERSTSTPWPNWSYKLRTSSSHKEGGERRWALQSLRFLGKDRVNAVEVTPVNWSLKPNGAPLKFETPAGKEELIQADMVMLAMGFLKSTRQETLSKLGLTDEPKIFIAGDAASGPSLVVRAIADGKKAADAIDDFLRREQA